MAKNTYDGLHEMAEALHEIADNIVEHSKSIDNLAQIVRWSFMDDFDKNVPNRIEQLAEAFQELNVLIEEAGRLLGIANKEGPATVGGMRND